MSTPHPIRSKRTCLGFPSATGALGRRALLLTLLGLGLAPAARAQDFDVTRDGFSFQNYTNEDEPINLTSEEVHRFFGDAVCASGSGPECLLTPQAEQWRQRTSDAMNGGHCEGMAVLALRMYLGEDLADDYGAETANALSLDDNEALQREIGYWWATQSIAPVSDAEQRIALADIIDRLDAAFDGGAMQYTLGFYKRDMSGGHAVTPIAVAETDDPDVLEIVLYDNNFPNEERTLEVDLANNEWSYVAAASPDVPESTYEGDNDSLTLGITPLAIRDGALECPFCGDYSAGSATERELTVTGEASILIMNEAGEELGHRPDGSFVNNIPGARFAPTRSDDLWAERSEATYFVPGGSELSVVIGDQGETPEPSDFTVFGEGYYMAIENILLDAGQTDLAVVGRDVARIRYETSAMETADVVLAAQTSGSDWLVVVRTRGASGGQTIEAELGFDDGGHLDLRFDGADDESQVDLFVERLDDDTLEFAAEDVTIPNGTDLRLRFAEFDRDGAAIALEADEDGDGTFEMSTPIMDSGSLPPGTGGGTTPGGRPTMGPADGGMSTPDAGVGGPDGGGAPPADPGEGGCSIRPTHGHGATVLVPLTVGLLWWRRRRA